MTRIATLATTFVTVLVVLAGCNSPFVPSQGDSGVGDTTVSSVRGSAVAALSSEATFVYQTVYSGAEFDSGRDEVVDESGNAYILGRAYDYSNDVMVVKLSPDGDVLFTTYLRGALNDWGTGLTLDGNGGLLVSGWTDSSDFPVVDAAQPVKDNRRSGFIARISTGTGAIVYSSFFGAGGSDELNDIAVNDAGEIFLVGKTDSTDFPTRNALQPNLNTTYGLLEDAFVVRLSADARTVLYGTYLGGERDDWGDSIAVDSASNIYVAGRTKSDDFPTVNALQATRSGETDIWAARISSDGTQLDYSTYLGGYQFESLGRIAVDPDGYLTLAGTTNSSDYPTTPGAFQPVFGGGLVGTPGFGQRSAYDAFVTRLTPDGGSLVYSTYIGGGNDDEARGVVIDGAGNAYVVGYHISEDTPPSSFDITVSALNPTGDSLLFQVSEWSAVANDGHGIALGPDGDVYYTGAKNAPADLYAARLSDGGSPPPPTSGVLHVGDIDGVGGRLRKRGWRAQATVLVHDANENPIADATVKGTWSDGYTGNAQIVTDGNGIATMTTARIRKRERTVTFTVTSVEKSQSTYEPTDNHDPDGDSNGTVIVISRP